MCAAANASLLAAIAAPAAAAGFDLIAPLAITDADAPLSAFGRARALGVIVGNTRALWPRFLVSIAADPAALEDPDPLDRYVERALGAIVPAALGARAATIYVAHVRGDTGWLPIQRLAERAGLAALAPSGLSIHPIFGPWIALRALIAIDADGPAADAGPPPRGCDCARGCGPARDALARAGDPFDPRSDTWRAWAAVRLACPVGAAHRYPDDQLRYHYTRDLSLVAESVAASRAANLAANLAANRGPPDPAE